MVLPLAAVSAGTAARVAPHYNLNIIGVGNPKTAAMEGRHRPSLRAASGQLWINLAEGDYNVATANCFDATAPSSTCPIPIPTAMA